MSVPLRPALTFCIWTALVFWSTDLTSGLRPRPRTFISKEWLKKKEERKSTTPWHCVLKTVCTIYKPHFVKRNTGPGTDSFGRNKLPVLMNTDAQDPLHEKQRISLFFLNWHWKALRFPFFFFLFSWWCLLSHPDIASNKSQRILLLRRPSDRRGTHITQWGGEHYNLPYSPKAPCFSPASDSHIQFTNL